MRTLIFDIMTVGEDWDSLDAVTQQTLTKWVTHACSDPLERIPKIESIKQGLGASPLTGHIVALGLYDVEREQGAVYYIGAGTESDEHIGPYVFKQRSEQALLREFWEGARTYDTFVTFNGRQFVVPYIIHRSMAHTIRPSRELLTYRYLRQQSVPYHIDLQDELTFYGAMHTRPSLHLLCRAYGIVSPTITGVTEEGMKQLYDQQKFRDIALYSAANVVDITALYEKWLQLIAPSSFLHKIDLS